MTQFSLFIQYSLFNFFLVKKKKGKILTKLLIASLKYSKKKKKERKKIKKHNNDYNIIKTRFLRRIRIKHQQDCQL
jgi:hypothetical protein